MATIIYIICVQFIPWEVGINRCLETFLDLLLLLLSGRVILSI